MKEEQKIQTKNTAGFMDSNVKHLYDAMISQGYTGLGDFSNFEGKMKDSGKRRMVYDYLIQDDYFSEIGDFSKFESALGYSPAERKDYVSQSSVNPAPIALRQEVDVPMKDQSEYVNPWTNSPDYNFESLRKKGKIETATPPPPTEYEKDSSFMNTWVGDAIQKLNAGGADLGAGIFGVLDKVSKGLESATGGLIPRGGAFKDISDRFKADAEFSRARSNRYNGKDFTDLWKEGNYMGAIGDIALQGVESLPMSIGAMAATMAGAPAAGLAGIGSIVASQKYDDLDQNNPNMGEFAKVSNAILTGTAESLSEMLGAGVSKAWMSTLFKTLGKEKAQEAIKRGIMGKMQEFYKKFGMFFEPVNEGIEEVSSTLAENITDKITGADPERDLTDGVLQSFVYGMGGGAYFTGAGALAKGAQYVADKIEGKQAQQPITDSNVADQGIDTPPQLTKSRFAEAEEEGRNMTDPGDIRTASKKMEETRLSLSEMVPGLASTIESYVDDGASEAQVMSLLDGVNADARPLAEEFYADYLRISGLQDRIGEEIDNEVETYVANNITPYVTTNPDGQSIVTTATLSEGNVERPVYVRSIEGDKAVISDNGQDRMVSVKRLSDIVEQDAGHMRRTYEDQLLATRQSELDMTMNHNPKTQLPKPGLIVWNGDNAFILQGQDENGDWIAQPAAYDRETGQVTAKNGSSPAMPITENEILDLQDAIYDAQQVNVMSPEDDNVASADAEITSAPPVEDAINQPTSEIETEGAIDQIAQPSNVETLPMVMREDGTPDFVSSGTDMTLDFLHDKYGDKMPRKIEVTRKSFDESLKKASDALEKAQEAYDDAPIGKEDKAEAALIKARQEYEAIKVEADFWANLDDDIKEASKKPGDVIAKEISVMGDPMSGEELAAMMLANGAIKLTRDSYKKETGAGNNETARMFGLFASPEKGGVNIERAGEILELADRENGTNFFDENDTNAGRDAIIEVLSSAHTRGDLIDYVKRNREAIAERERQAEYNAYAEWCEENYHMSPEEYEAYEDDLRKQAEIVTEETIEYVNGEIADEIQAIINEQNEIDAILAQNNESNEEIERNDKGGTGGLLEGGDQLLQGEQPIQVGRTGETEQGFAGVDDRVDRTDGATQEGAPEEVDRQGNPIDSEGNLIIEDVSSVSDITDEDFINPKRSIGLPPIPQNVSEAIASDGKKVIIKRNIFEKNAKKHAFDPQSSRDILEAALYNTDIVGQSQPLTRKNHWVAIKLDDKSPIVVLEVNHNKDNVEIVGWYTLDNRNLDRIKRQAEREGGELLILTPKGAAASLSTLPDNSSSTDKGSISSSENQANEAKSFVAPSPNENENPLDYAERIVEAKRLFDEELKVNTNPSEAQKEAGNYKKGHVKINGFDVSIEQPVGSVRSGKDASGKEWSQVMNNTYGYIRGTESVDGDHIDVFLGPDMNSDMVYVVDQVNTDGSFDEHKVMMGFSSLEDARSAYLSNYEEGWQGLGNITGVALDEFKKWIDSSIRKTKPFSEYKSVVPVSPLTVSRSDKSNEYPLLDIAVDPIVWMKNNPGKTPTSKDLFPAGKADEYLGTIIDEQVVTTDKGITLKYTKYNNGYSITAEKEGGYIKQSYYNNGLPMTSPKFNIGVNDSSFKQYIKKSKDGTLYIDNKDIIPLFVEDVSRKVKKLSLVDKDDYITSAERKHIKAFLESGLKEARVNNSIYEISNIGDDGVYEIVRRFNYTDPLTLVKDENGKLVNKRGEGEHVIRVKPTFEETRPDSGIRFRETRIIPEEENIIKKAKSDGSYMKAPNGNPTNLNEKQWVQVRTKAFKEWFGDWENDPENASKVIDENGEPRVVYHGTDSDFNAFDESHLGEVTDLNATNEDWAKTSHIGFWFNDNKIGFYTKHKPVYLNVRNPLEFASMESLVDEMSYYDSGEDFKRSNSDGYDSVIVLEDEEMGGRSYSVFNDNQIKSATENNGGFSSHNDDIRFREVKDKNGEKSLVGLHNISEEKLRKALRQGGFANPSAAVIDISRQSHTGYGSISLVLPSSMIEKRTGKNAGTWSQDAWTPIYPTIERQFSGKGSDAFSKDLQKLPEEMRSTTKSGMDSYMDGRGEDSLAYMYLYEQGKAPEISRTKPSYPEKTRTEVEDATNGSFSMSGLSDKQLSRLKDTYMEYKGFSTEGYNEAIKLRRAKLEEAIGKMNPRSILYEKRKMDLERIDKYGFDYSAVESFMKSVRDDISNSDKVDAHGTMRDSWNFIEENGMRGDFNKWLDKLNERYGIKEIIFNGFTPSGIRKYIPNTLENVSKFMKKQGRSASVGIGASFQNFAASLLDAKGSLKDIRKDKGKLTTDHADVDAFRDKWSKVFHELGEKLQPDAKGYDDYGLYRLAEAARSKDPQKYIKEEYGIDFSDEDVKTLNEMVDAIRNEYPAMYFETKFERPVYLEEFAAAVVPDNVDGDIRKAIYDAGLKIFTYKADDEISRNEAVKQASEIDGVRFRSIGEKGAANLNKAETIESSINDWSTKFNTPVKVIHDVDDITDTDENMLARKRDSKGWYDTSTGEIVIVSPNSTSVGDAQRTFLHEVVGHHGLRELFGDDFDTFLDNVYRNANEDIWKNIIDRTKGNPLNLREATEEYIAELAERGFDNKAERSLWEKIKDAFLDMLRKAGISLDFKLSDNDLRYILWRSYKNLEQGNLMDVAEDIVMRNRLSLNNINLNENGSIARDIEPKKGKQPSETKGTRRELETIEGVNENGNESERDHIDKPRGVENAIDGTENATDRNGKKTDGQVDNDGDQLDGGDTGDRNGSVRDGIDGERTVIGRAGSENKGRGVGESVREKTDDFSFAERIKKENDNIRLREAKSEVEDEEPLNKEMVDAWDKVASSDSFKFKEAMVDSLTAIDEFLKLLAKKTKSKILDYENPYYSLIALSSKNKVDMDSFDSKFLNPLNEAIRALIGDASEVSKKGLRRTWDWSKGALRDLVKYVQAKHGIERNRDMSVRDGIETLKAFDVDVLSKMGVISESDLKNAKKAAEKVAEEKGSEAYKKTYDKVLGKELKKGVDKGKAERSAEIAADYRKSFVKSEIYNKEMDKYKEKVTGTLIDRWEDSKKDILNKDLAWDEEQKELDREALSFQWKLGDNSYGVILGKDYSGLSSVFKSSEDGANKDKWLSDAYDFVRDYESTHNMVLVDNLWDKVHNVSEYTLRKQYESGLISKSYMDKNLSRFKYFIPLRGFSDNIASDVYDYIDATEIKMGNPVKTAKGRISEADNPFAGLIHVGYGSITAGNRNLAKQRFLNLASNHDTGGLITIDNIWVRNVGTEENPEWVESIPQIPDNASGEEVAKAVKDHEEMMRELREEGKAELIKGGRSDIPYKTLYDQRSQHQVQVFVGGNRYVMTVNGNPRLAQAVNGLTNPDVKDDLAYVVARNLKTFMAGAFTSKNVAFSFANLIRDTPYANNSVFVTENFRYFKDFSGNQRRALFGLRSLGRNLYKYRRGEIDISDKEQAIFKEFMDNGGATGYTFVETQKEYAKDLANKLEKLSDGNIGKLSPKELVSTVFECFEFMGNVAELVNRYAAYKTSREHGRSIDRSINDAKEVSVNFNKKGAGKKTKSDKWYINTAAWISEYGRDWVLFFNAAVQSMYKEYSMLRNHPIKGISSRIAPLIFMGSSVSLLNNLFMPMLFAYLGWDSDDDDDRDYFDSLSDHERQNNICIRLTHGRWLKIPLSPELANYFKIGDIIAGQLSGKREVEAMDVVKTGIDMVSPLNINWEYDSWKFALNLLPTVVQPIAQNASNVNFMGNPIYKTSMNKANDYDPEYTKVYRSTSTTMVELSRALNSLTGGDDVKRGTSFNPATWQNILSGYTGGFGTVALGVSDLVLDMLSGENGDMPVSRYPLLSRFLTGGDKDLKLSRMNSIYNKKVVDFVSEMDHDYKGYLKKIQDTSVDDFDRAGYMVKLNQLTGSDDYRRSMVLSQYVKAISDMERFLREVGSDNDSLENQVYELKLQALEIFEDSDE